MNGWRPAWRLNRRWLFNRRVGAALLWMGVVIGAAVVVNLAGIRIVGWQRWLHAHAFVFLIWRLGLYAVTARGWWWMRQRVQRREPAVETRQRLLRIEIAAVAAIALMEGSAWLQHGRGGG
ncbi:hypothetical protein [Burkholderia cepacia]|uniref:hypothetical protein n=1 Tax=Burkholderia cepacia TaxID=292 RepID=UPI002AB7B34F|nr:hypothetical protein [Burkholderia cepacia]